MSYLSNHRKIVTDGLVFVVDSGNIRSYSGSGTSVNSMSDLSQTGTLVNGVSFVDNSFEFDGVDDRISFGDILKFGDEDFTIQAWVNISTLTSGRVVFAKYGTVNYSYRLFTSGTSLAFVVSDGAASFGTATSPSVTEGVWYLVTCYHDSVGNEVGISIDESGATTTSYSSGANGSSTLSFDIGGQTVGGNYLNCKVPNVKAYNKVLTASEISQNYNANKIRFT